MKKIVILLLLLAYTFCLQAQEDHSRAETLLYQAVEVERNGASLEQLGELYTQIAQIDPEYPNVYYAWSLSIAIKAKENKDENLYKQSFEKIQKAIEIDSAYVEAYHLWGIYLAEYAYMKKDSNLFEESISKFHKAIEIRPEYVESYCLWAGFLAEYAKFKDYDLSLFQQSFDVFRKTEEIAPGSENVNILWGSVLTQLADKKNDTKLYKESIEKYNKALEKGTNPIDANNGKGYSYMQLGKAENNLLKYKSQIESSFHIAEEKQSQSAAYNLACFYSLIKEKDKALLWLERTITRNYGLKINEFGKQKIEKDSDFDNIRKEKRYKEIMNQYFSK